MYNKYNTPMNRWAKQDEHNKKGGGGINHAGPINKC
jgi:hypothetical protein